ncbi:hypothetical protein AB0469_31625 [Streptomyces sp. NPDC093801]|uniref:hypothetical protein n=1 Tax=Streptomyces sp. NPDC093801 TaxID=3155203 RepID=UPI00344F300B
MNAHQVRAAAGALHAAMERGAATPAELAYDLEAAGLLQSPESAAELARLRARVAQLEADRYAEVSAWLYKKAREYRSTRNREHAVQAEVLERMASKVARGGIRPTEDPYDSPLHHDYRLGRELPEVPRG